MKSMYHQIYLLIIIFSCTATFLIGLFFYLKRKNSNRNLPPENIIDLIVEKEKFSKYPNFFPKKTCLILSNYIYNLLSNDGLNDERLILEIILLKYEIVDEAFRRLQGIENFDKIKQMLNDKNEKFQIFNYLKDLILISKNFFNFNINNRFVIRDFVNFLISKDITLGMTSNSLEYKIPEIFDFLKQNNTNFKLHRKKKQELINENGYKECSRCGEMKPYVKFDTTKGRLRYICRECASIEKSIYIFKKKIKILRSLFKNVRCNECNVSIERLPCLEIHHNNVNFKTFSWRDLLSKNSKSILETLKEENVVLLCTNCHLLKQAKNYSEHKTFILNRFFLKTSEDVIRNIVYNYVKNQNLNYRSTEKQQILKWIKKRIVINTLYNDECIGCNRSLGDIELASFEFHHKFGRINDKFKWQEISKLSLNQISSHLINEGCVALCSNCHQIIHATNYVDNLEKIFPQKDKDLIETIKSDFEGIIKNITQFSYKPNNHSTIFTSKNWLTSTKLRIVSLLERSSYSIDEICDLLDLKRTDCFSKLKDLELKGLILKSEKRIFKFSLSNEGKDLIRVYKYYRNELSEILGLNF